MKQLQMPATTAAFLLPACHTLGHYC